MNKYIVTLIDGSKVEIPTEFTINQVKADLIAKKIAFKSVAPAGAPAVSNKWERKTFPTFDEAKSFLATVTCEKKGIDKKSGLFTVWYAN